VWVEFFGVAYVRWSASTLGSVDASQARSAYLQPGKTVHWLVDEKGKRPFPPFVSLAIAQYEGDADYYLLHECKDHFSTDTCHTSLEDALHQAEFQFGVTRDEWIELPLLQ
jgi:hypothetical protein